MDDLSQRLTEMSPLALGLLGSGVIAAYYLLRELYRGYQQSRRKKGGK